MTPEQARNTINTRGRQYHIDRARRRKAHRLSAVILDVFAEQAECDMEGLIAMLKNYTAAEWLRLARLASTSPPSMATCGIVFDNLRR